MEHGRFTWLANEREKQKHTAIAGVALVLGVASELEGLGLAEVDRGADLAGLLADTLLDSLGGSLGLLDDGLGLGGGLLDLLLFGSGGLGGRSSG